MITKRFISTTITFFSILLFFTFGTSSGGEDSPKLKSQETAEKPDTGKYLSKGDTLFVIHFHPTVQCSCCINVGNFSKKSLEKYYAQLYKSRRIIFKECNIDEDSLTAKKYQIFWSALGFQKSLKGKVEFKEIESVWDFCEDEVKFLPTFKKELDEFINSWKKEEGKGKSKE